MSSICLSALTIIKVQGPHLVNQVRKHPCHTHHQPGSDKKIHQELFHTVTTNWECLKRSPQPYKTNIFCLCLSFSLSLSLSLHKRIFFSSLRRRKKNIFNIELRVPKGCKIPVLQHKGKKTAASGCLCKTPCPGKINQRLLAAQSGFRAFVYVLLLFIAGMLDCSIFHSAQQPKISYGFIALHSSQTPVSRVLCNHYLRPMSCFVRHGLPWRRVWKWKLVALNGGREQTFQQHQSTLCSLAVVIKIHSLLL